MFEGIAVPSAHVSRCERVGMDFGTEVRRSLVTTVLLCCSSENYTRLFAVNSYYFSHSVSLEIVKCVDTCARVVTLQAGSFGAS